MGKKGKGRQSPNVALSPVEPGLGTPARRDASASTEGNRVVPEILPDRRDRAVEIQLESIESTEMFAGPLPPPSALAAYGRIQKDLVGRIVEMAEKQQAHRHRMEDRITRSSTILSFMGLASGLIIGLAGLGLATKMVLEGHDVAGSIIGGVDLVALVGTFVLGKRRRSRRNDDADERGQEPTPIPARFDEGSIREPSGIDEKEPPGRA